MKEVLIFAAFLMMPQWAVSQTRTIIINAPKPPTVPLDGGISALLLAGGAIAYKTMSNPKKNV